MGEAIRVRGLNGCSVKAVGHVCQAEVGGHPCLAEAYAYAAYDPGRDVRVAEAEASAVGRVGDAAEAVGAVLDGGDGRYMNLQASPTRPQT